MNKVQLFTLLPVILGVLLVGVVVLDVYQYRVGSIDLHDALTREVILVAAGLLSSFCLVLFTCYWLIKRRWRLALVALSSVLFFLVCFVVAGSQGGVFLYAT